MPSSTGNNRPNSSSSGDFPENYFVFCADLKAIDEKIKKELARIPEEEREEYEKRRLEEYLSDFMGRWFFEGEVFFFLGKEELLERLKKEIAEFFNVPPYRIYIAGSAKIGFDYMKRKEVVFRWRFQHGDDCSDIDVAIIDKDCFVEYEKKIGEVNRRKKTEPFEEFALTRGAERFESCKNYLVDGWIRPLEMPKMMPEREEWMSFCRDISKGGFDSFIDCDVTCGVYRSKEDFIGIKKNSIKEIFEKVRNGKINIPPDYLEMPSDKIEVSSEAISDEDRERLILEVIIFLPGSVNAQDLELFAIIEELLGISQARQQEIIEALLSENIVTRVGDLYFFNDKKRGVEKLNYLIENDSDSFMIITNKLFK